MLGQDIVTQEEFDAFVASKFVGLERKVDILEQDYETEIERLNGKVANYRVASISGLVLSCLSLVGLALVVFLL